MHLTPHELDKLTLHQAGVLAQKRLARGVRLNHPEAVALIATQLLEFIRDGKRVAELMDLGRKFLGRNQGMPVAELMDLGHKPPPHNQTNPTTPKKKKHPQTKATFPNGTKLVTVHHP